jgi:hypothetical protein
MGVPDGYDKDAPLGRPEEKSSNINTQGNAFGRDRLGKHDMKVDDTEGPSLRPNYKGGSPLAMENIRKNSKLIESLDKNLVFKKEDSSLLDESQIRE